MTPTESGTPTVHTTIFRLGQTNIEENIDQNERKIRLLYRPIPNVVSASLFFKAKERGIGYHQSIIEKFVAKNTQQRWLEYFKDLKDRRDVMSYLYMKWYLN